MECLGRRRSVSAVEAGCIGFVLTSGCLKCQGLLIAGEVGMGIEMGAVQEHGRGHQQV